MKREFLAMMKAHAGCGVSVVPRRVTRSQNVSLRSGLVLRSPERERKSEVKRRRKETKRREVEKVGETETVEVEKVEEKDIEKMVVMSEDDEPKSDVLDGSFDQDGKADMVEVEKGDTGSLVKCEHMGVKAETNISIDNVDIESSVARTNVEIDSLDGNPLETEKYSLENYMQENTAVVDGVHKEVHEMTDSQVKELKADFKSGKGFEAVHVSAEGSEEVSVPVKPMRRFIKQMNLHPETSVGEDVQDMEPLEKDHIDSRPAKTELKLSKRAFSKRRSLKLKEVLETGLLEGLHVRYARGAKVKGQPETTLEGVIRGLGILCYCEKCNSSEIVTPNEFVLHAGSANKRPPEYIYFDNGKSLRDVLNICKNVPCESLEQAIQSAIGCFNEKSSNFCLNCKGHISVTGNGRTLICDSCVASKESQGSQTQVTDNSERSSICISGTKSSEQMASSIPRSKSKGRLTRKDLRMHRLVLEEDVLRDGTELAYYARGKKMLEGYKKGFGIFCYCCENEVSPSVFEAHAGYGSRRKPYLNIYISNGVSLHELSVWLAKERKISAVECDDLCSICADGGDLLSCDSCPRAFHTDCVSLPNLPQGAWHCRYCENTFLREKFVEHNANAIAAGRVLGVPLDQLMTRCIRIVENLDADFRACVLCRGKDFSKSGFGPQTVIICDQCEKEYHVGCLKEHNMDHLMELPDGNWFCCVECDKVHTALEKLVAEGEMRVPEYLLAMIKEKHADLESSDSFNLDVRWRLLRGKLANEETRKLLSGAVTIFHECFNPIVDASTSPHLDLVPQMVYGRNFKDQDLGGMYTAVLTVNSTVVCAGIIRIFGQVIAELPLVATSTKRQGQGYFQCLFSCMENLLASLDVKDLVLPAAKRGESLWINKAGFQKITLGEMKDYRKDYRMMMFQGTSMLHKSVPKSSYEFVIPS